MFALESRKYIESLIRIQKHIREQGYERDDQQVVNECRRRIQPLIEGNQYHSNQRMSRFWINHREEIRYLVPTSNYKGFKALLYHFECLDNESKKYQSINQFITLQNQ
jgi:hypothetical protein